jgi:hypothetical protein
MFKTNNTIGPGGTLKAKVMWAPQLWELAVGAHKLAKKGPSHFDQAIVAIVFSAAFLEAFMNELLDNACELSARTRSKKIRMLAVLGQWALDPQKNMGLKTKFELAKIILSGKPYNTGTRPYQDFDGLLRLRNSIVHMDETDEIIATEHSGDTVEEGRILLDSRFASVKRPKAMEWLKSKGISPSDPQEDSLRCLCRPETSEVACEAASAMIRDVLSWRMPQDLEQMVAPYHNLSPVS